MAGTATYSTSTFTLDMNWVFASNTAATDVIDPFLLERGIRQATLNAMAPAQKATAFRAEVAAFVKETVATRKKRDAMVAAQASVESQVDLA